MSKIVLGAAVIAAGVGGWAVAGRDGRSPDATLSAAYALEPSTPVLKRAGAPDPAGDAYGGVVGALYIGGDRLDPLDSSAFAIAIARDGFAPHAGVDVGVWPGESRYEAVFPAFARAQLEKTPAGPCLPGGAPRAVKVAFDMLEETVRMGESCLLASSDGPERRLVIGVARVSGGFKGSFFPTSICRTLSEGWMDAFAASRPDAVACVLMLDADPTLAEPSFAMRVFEPAPSGGLANLDPSGAADF